MKRYLSFILIVCLILLVSCKTKTNTHITALIPANIKGMTVSLNNLGLSASQNKKYSARSDQIKQLENLLSSIELTPLSDNDLLSFSQVGNPSCANMCLEFDGSKKLYIFSEGGISIDNAGKLLSYAISADSFYLIAKILVTDFEKDFTSISQNTNYVKPVDFNPEKVNEISFYLPFNRTIHKIIDGFIGLLPISDGKSDYFIRAVKYDEHGNFVWMKDYTAIKSSIVADAFLSTSGGGFAFIACENFNSSKSYLVSCDKNGGLLWHTQFQKDRMNSLCQTKSGDIVALGYTATDGPTDIALSIYDSSGKCTKERTFGGSDFDNFISALYTPDIGLVVLGSTQSCDGDITARKEKGTMLYPVDFIAVFDNNLNEKWQYVFENNQGVFSSHLATDGKYLYVAGNIADKSAKSNKTGVFKFDSEGTVLNFVSLNAGMFSDLSCAKDNSILLCVNPTINQNQSKKSQVYKLDSNIKTIKIIDDTNGGALNDTVIPADDGGFFTVKTQIVKYLPQPKWMNRCITDYATVLSKFDQNGKLLFRKTYDKNHYAENQDVVIPLPDGKVIVNK
jgi:hypothetical protein